MTYDLTRYLSVFERSSSTDGRLFKLSSSATRVVNLFAFPQRVDAEILGMCEKKKKSQNCEVELLNGRPLAGPLSGDRTVKKKVNGLGWVSPIKSDGID